MKPLRARKKLTARNSMFAIAAGVFLLACIVIILWIWSPSSGIVSPFRYVGTVAGTKGEFGEPFGIAVKRNEIYLSDGENGKIWRISGGETAVFATGLDTPSSIAFDKVGNLIVADSGSHTIKSIDSKGSISTVAGVEGQSGFADGDAASALFNAPIGVAIADDGRIFVADTFNDRIRVIEKGKVSTLAGGNWGFADGVGLDSKFYTPCGIVAWQDKLLVADTGNRRIRVVEPDGRVWTLAGNGESDLKDGLLSSAMFVAPAAITINKYGSIFIADGNSIREIGGHAMPIVSTVVDPVRGIHDGLIIHSRFNRPSGLAFDDSGQLLVADSDNRLIRRLSAASSGQEITTEQVQAIRDKPEEFRKRQPPRWPFDPPNAKRDIAGTMGEIRGDIPEKADGVHFHNGLDIAGAYGETARFVRDEKVLYPLSAQNFGTLRELLRLPEIGYIHVRLGRDSSNRSFGDPRFQFVKNAAGALVDIRVPRGAKFAAGEAIGTLNAMNHVHLIAGGSGSEMNALDALVLPNLTDSRTPVIEKVTLFDENWHEVETVPPNGRIKLAGKTRIVVRAYDQADGNSDRRRLGLYRIGYKVTLDNIPTTVGPKAEIKFDRLPPADAAPYVYATGSHSGATGETIFNYIATNSVEGDDFSEGFIDPAELDNRFYVLHVFAEDYFGNAATKSINIEIAK